MWRAFFLSVGAMLFIVGVETLLIDSATIYASGDSSAANLMDPGSSPAAKTTEVKPAE